MKYCPLHVADSFEVSVFPGFGNGNRIGKGKTEPKTKCFLRGMMWASSYFFVKIRIKIMQSCLCKVRIVI
jgi:hypothetical protein